MDKQAMHDALDSVLAAATAAYPEQTDRMAQLQAHLATCHACIDWADDNEADFVKGRQITEARAALQALDGGVA